MGAVAGGRAGRCGGGPAVPSARGPCMQRQSPFYPSFTRTRTPAENLELVRAGCVNLAKHIANARAFGVPVVVAINRFATDTDGELAVVKEEALRAGADEAAVATHHGQGGAGAVELAQAVMRTCQKPVAFKFTYPLDLPLKVGWGEAERREQGWGVSRGRGGGRRKASVGGGEEALPSAHAPPALGPPPYPPHHRTRLRPSRTACTARAASSSLPRPRRRWRRTRGRALPACRCAWPRRSTPSRECWGAPCRPAGRACREQGGRVVAAQRVC